MDSAPINVFSTEIPKSRMISRTLLGLYQSLAVRVHKQTDFREIVSARFRIMPVNAYPWSTSGKSKKTKSDFYQKRLILAGDLLSVTTMVCLDHAYHDLTSRNRWQTGWGFWALNEPPYDRYTGKKDQNRKPIKKILILAGDNGSISRIVHLYGDCTGHVWEIDGRRGEYKMFQDFILVAKFLTSNAALIYVLSAVYHSLFLPSETFVLFEFIKLTTKFHCFRANLCQEAACSSFSTVS